MECESSLEYKIVLDTGTDTDVIGRLVSLDLATAAFTAAIARYPNRNIALRQGARIIKRHDGEPQPQRPRDPNLKEWSVHLIGGKKMRFLGYVEGVDEIAAVEAAVALFDLDDARRKRLAVSARRPIVSLRDVNPRL